MAKIYCLIWRLEDPDGAGPWYSGAVGIIQHKLGSFSNDGYCYDLNPSRHAGVSDPGLTKALDKRGSIDKRFVFGCRRLATVLEWFNVKWQRDILHAEGLKLVQYRVPARYCCHSYLQSVFRKDKATPTGKTRAANWR